jgi:hypothetical protein
VADHEAVGAPGEPSVGQQRDVLAEALADKRRGHREHRRKLPGNDPPGGAAQARTRFVRLARQRIDVLQQRSELEMLVEVERQQFRQQRETLVTYLSPAT